MITLEVKKSFQIFGLNMAGLLSVLSVHVVSSSYVNNFVSLMMTFQHGQCFLGSEHRPDINVMSFTSLMYMLEATYKLQATFSSQDLTSSFF